MRVPYQSPRLVRGDRSGEAAECEDDRLRSTMQPGVRAAVLWSAPHGPVGLRFRGEAGGIGAYIAWRPPVGCPVGPPLLWQDAVPIGGEEDCGAVAEGRAGCPVPARSRSLGEFEAADLAGLAEAQVNRATLRVEATATAALSMGDVDGAYAAAYDAYRMAAEALLACQGLRATGVMGRIWRWRMRCRRSSLLISRPSPSRRSSGCGGPGTRRSISTRPRRRSPKLMRRGLSARPPTRSLV
jgi:hypothetical protein